MIRAAKSVLIKPLTELFNHIFTSKQYPQEWNKGIITPIHKKGSKLDPHNYRGITVNSVFAKIYSMVMCNRLETFLEENKIMNETQIGFRKKAQIADHMLVMQSLVEKYSEIGKFYICFIDFEKAYDSVWRQALLYKLLKQNIRGLFYHQIKSMYENVMVCVKQNGRTSEYFRSGKGVKQGEVMSPLLFNLFINDIHEIFNEDCDPVSLNGRKIPCLQYADDLIIMSQTREGLQNSLANLHTYCKTWKLNINISKSKVMVMGKGGRKVKVKLQLGGVDLEQVDQYSYLGITLSNTGTFTICKKNLTEKARKSMNRLKGLLWGTGIKKSLALKMFDQLVLPIMIYGCEIWAAGDIMKLLKLNVTSTFENTYDKIPQEKLNVHFCKFLLGMSAKSCNIAALGELGRYPIFIKALTRMMKYYARIKNMPKNSLMGDALQDMEHRSGRGKHTWNKAVQNIMDCLGLDLEQTCKDIAKSEYTKKKTGHRIQNLLENRYLDFWEGQMSMQHGKLDLYACLKSKFGYENYLDEVKINSHQRALTKLRTSNHRLNVETGRYKRPYIARHERICELCDTGIEDEFHFLFQCPIYREIRKNKLGQDMILGNKQELVVGYLSNFKTVPAPVIGAYVYEAMAHRQKLLTNQEV